ncbi:hypothetical protein [Cognatishimia sp. MH4019]|uniref:hypothetical protein n=1 Tax=Cognatishimia sp. MH4019 TaxID=2854030 RepID=UPI001CD29CE0|nr:hypothetical protein [Cognatishimia sp. MH4019]
MRDTPWHLFPVAGLAVIWFLFSGLDYVMTQLRFEGYLALFSAEQVAYFTALPQWVNAAWAIGVWLGLLGAILLLYEQKSAPVPLALSFVGMALASLWFTALSTPLMVAVTGPLGLVVIWGATLVSLLFWVYARVQRKNDILE